MPSSTLIGALSAAAATAIPLAGAYAGIAACVIFTSWALLSQPGSAGTGIRSLASHLCLAPAADRPAVATGCRAGAGDGRPAGRAGRGDTKDSLSNERSGIPAMVWQPSLHEVDLHHWSGCHQVIELGLTGVPHGLRPGEHLPPEGCIPNRCRPGRDVVSPDVDRQVGIRIEVGQPVTSARCPCDDEATVDMEPPDLDPPRFAGA